LKLLNKKLKTALAAVILSAVVMLTSCGNNGGSSSEKTNTATADSSDLYVLDQKTIDSPDWVTGLPEAKDENNKQLFVIGAMGDDLTTATVSMNERDENGEWKQILSTPAYVGMKGMCEDKDRVAGNKKTPMGTYHFTKAFGIADDPGCAMPYTKVNEDIYWSGDDREGMHYNEMVNIKDFPDLNTEDSERIVDYEYEYRYCLNISFNEEGTPGRGSAIFLHCLGTKKPYTGGCVAVPEYIMKMIMQRVDPDCVVVIGLFDDMGGSF